jgi:hypothetical protein
MTSSVTENTVLVLGAGFSRAISPDAPLTDELGDLVMEQLGSPDIPGRPDSFRDGYFELWLSRLAENQPDLREAENLLNRHWFSRITDAIYDILTARERSIVEAGLPDWLMTLVGVAHATKLTMITFNYDALVDIAVNQYGLWDWESGIHVTNNQIIDELPALPTNYSTVGGGRTFHLLKLHGSTYSYWAPGDVSGATISRWSPPPDNSAAEAHEDARQRAMPGRSPFLVPPAAAKSSYYDNPMMRELWHRAAKALAAADHVFVMGYSLPVTDPVVSTIFAQYLGNRDLTLTVADLSPQPIYRRLEALGIKSAPFGHRPQVSFTTMLDGEQSIVEATTMLVDISARKVLQELVDNDLDADAPIMVAWNPEHAAAVIDAQLIGGTLALTIEELTSIQIAARARFEPEAPPIVRMGRVRELITSGARDAHIELPSGVRSHFVSLETWHSATGVANKWYVFIPALPPWSTNGSP